jgi:hypothetical protein
VSAFPFVPKAIPPAVLTFVQTLFARRQTPPSEIGFSVRSKLVEYDGVPVTATVVDALAVPPSPVHARVNTLVVANAPLD